MVWSFSLTGAQWFSLTDLALSCLLWFPPSFCPVLSLASSLLDHGSSHPSSECKVICIAALWQHNWVFSSHAFPFLPLESALLGPIYTTMSRNKLWGLGLKLPSLSVNTGSLFFLWCDILPLPLVWGLLERQPPFGTLTGSQARPLVCPQYCPQTSQWAFFPPPVSKVRLRMPCLPHLFLVHS